MAATVKKQMERNVLHAEVDQAEVLAKVKEIERDINSIQKRAGEIRVEDDDDWRVAAGLLLATKEKLNYVSEERKGFLADVQKLVDRVEGWFAKALEDGEALEASFRAALKDRVLALEARAHGLRLAAAKLPAKDAAKSEKLFEEANTCVAPKVPGIVPLLKVRAEITDEKKLPEWAWKRVVDMKAIEAKLQANEIVPGAKGVLDVTIRVTPAHAKKGGDL